MKGSCGLLLQLFAEVIGEKEIVDVALVAKGILVMRTNGRVKMILNLPQLAMMKI